MNSEIISESNLRGTHAITGKRMGSPYDYERRIAVLSRKRISTK
jgi:hypothetical protein